MINIYVRQNNKSIDRKQDVRPNWFNYERCFQSLLGEGRIVVCLDGEKSKHHFNIEQYDGIDIREFNGGSDHASFQFVLDSIKNDNLPDDDIVYIVEDDYLHSDSWGEFLQHTFKTIGADYISLYDHPDKYMPMYSGLQSQILYDGYLHWRTTPSTCNTYAMRMKTLRADWDIHYKYCDPKITHDGYDHTKFLELGKNGRTLITPIPGLSTHCEIPFLTPSVDWEQISK